MATITLTRWSSSSFNRIRQRFSSRVQTNSHRRHQMTTSSSLEAKQLENIAAPYGSWKSPISADVVSGASKRLGGTAVDSLGRLIWLESRPSESGYPSLYINLLFPILSECVYMMSRWWIIWCIYRRAVLVREPEKPEDEPVDITPKDYAVRTVAQEYGGGAFSVSGDTIIFSNYKDQRLYKQSLSSNGMRRD